MTQSSASASLFLSYSSIDRHICEEIVAALRPLEVKGATSIWYDRSLTPGDRYYDEIMRHLRDARLILLLVSANYLASHACSVEAKQAIAQATDGSSKVLPVIVGDCDWKNTPYAVFQVLPPRGEGLTTGADRTAALAAIVHGVEKAIADCMRPTRNPDLEVFPDSDLREMVTQIETSIAVIRKAYAFQPSLPIQVMLEVNQLEERKQKFETELSVRRGRF